MADDCICPNARPIQQFTHCASMRVAVKVIACLVTPKKKGRRSALFK
jgi:hypothetical protein